jgi:copper chaperone CopZ
MKGRGIYVVGIRQENVGIEALTQKILRMDGVSEVEFNYLTRKLTVNHDGSQETVDAINRVLEDVIRLKKKKSSPD